MRRYVVLGLVLLVMLPAIGCQKIQRLPEIISKRTSVGSSSPIPEYTTSPIPEYSTSPIPEYSTSPIPESVMSQIPETPLQNGTYTGAYSGGTGQLEARRVNISGNNREYYVYVPSSARSGQPAPLVIAFHGGGGGAQGFADRMGLVGMAERYGMVLVLPQGLGRKSNGRGSWNANSVSPQGYAERSGVNDIGFVDALLRNVSGSYNIDRSRVYAMGFSKGGMMAYRAACVLRGQITAIAAVSATLSSADCPNPQGVSVLHIHGTNDQNVPFTGGVGADTGGRANWPPVQRGLQYFTSGNQCLGQPQSMRISNDTSCTINRCGNNEQVQLCLVQGGGHAWPGAQPAQWQINRNVKVSQSFNATDYIARFLLAH